MKLLDLCKLGLTVGVSIALFSACSQGDAGSAGVPVVSELRFHAQPAGAHRDAAGPKVWDLLYISNSDGTVTVYRYWQYLVWTTLRGFKTPRGECTDTKHNVFITDAGAAEVVEYHHGVNTVENRLSDAGYQPVACSSDPTTGKLAVANALSKGRKAGNVAIYTNASGKPVFYQPNLGAYGPLACGYDDAGNLLIATEYSRGSYEYALFAMLYKGAKSFAKITLSKIQNMPYQSVSNVQWDGKYWAIADNGNIVRYTIAKGKAPVYEGTTTLSGNGDSQARFWITNFDGLDDQQGTQIVAAESQAVLYWRYPSGGGAIHAVVKSIYEPYGVTVSLAPND